MKLHIDKLNKSYNKKVLNNLTYNFEQGKIYTIIGRNGAGKTTFFNCLMNNIEYENGEITIDEITSRNLIFEDIALVEASPNLPDFLTGFEYVKFYLDINKDKVNHSKEIDEYFDFVRMNEYDRHRLIKEYSYGMKNKIQLICILISKPKIILLDEPLTALDIIVSHDIKEVLLELKNEHIIIMSTHILQLAKDVSDEIAILKNGELKKSKYDIHDEYFDEYIVKELEGENA